MMSTAAKWRNNMRWYQMFSINKGLLSLANQSCMCQATERIHENVIKGLKIQRGISTLPNTAGCTAEEMIMVATVMSLLTSHRINFRDVQVGGKVDSPFFPVVNGCPEFACGSYWLKLVQEWFWGVTPEWVWTVARGNRIATYKSNCSDILSAPYLNSWICAISSSGMSGSGDLTMGLPAGSTNYKGKS